VPQEATESEPTGSSDDRQRPTYMDAWCHAIVPLGALAVFQEPTKCGLEPRKCPFCLWLCFEPLQEFKDHIIKKHTSFSELFRSWDEVSPLTPRVLYNWRLETRSLIHQTPKLQLACLKIWYSKLKYFSYVCPLCAVFCSTQLEVQQHMLLEHLTFRKLQLN
jgi:hypothetical protein